MNCARSTAMSIFTSGGCVVSTAVPFFAAAGAVVTFRPSVGGAGGIASEDFVGFFEINVHHIFRIPGFDAKVFGHVDERIARVVGHSIAIKSAQPQHAHEVLAGIDRPRRCLGAVGDVVGRDWTGCIRFAPLSFNSAST